MKWICIKPDLPQICVCVCVVCVCTRVRVCVCKLNITHNLFFYVENRLWIKAFTYLEDVKKICCYVIGTNCIWTMKDERLILEQFMIWDLILLSLAKSIFVNIKWSLPQVFFLYYPLMQMKWLIANSYTVIFLYKCENLTYFGFISFLETTLNIESL